jgi:hypothetical protein
VTANARLHTTSRPTTTQKDWTSATSSSATELTTAAASMSDVRFRTSPRSRGADRPPTIWAPATIAAARPAMP